MFSLIMFLIDITTVCLSITWLIESLKIKFEYWWVFLIILLYAIGNLIDSKL